MAFCSYDKELLSATDTLVDNKFLSRYMPEATGDAVKVYLYGLYACAVGGDELSIDKFAEELKLDKAVVIDCFRFWDELGIITILSEDPFLVKYLRISSLKPKKYNLEKYTGFNRALQVLIPDRMITTTEYSAYFQLMEDFSIKPEAMLMIVRYCVELKGSSIGFRYVLKVANDFASRGITTVSKIEKELSDYTSRTGAAGEIFAALIPNRKPDIDETNLVKKWTENYAFDVDSVLFAAKQIKTKNLQRLDRELSTLFANKKFSLQELKSYYKERATAVELAYEINKALSVYVEVIDPVVDNYVVPWLNKGYEKDSLLFLANYCFKKNKRSLEDLNEIIEKAYKNGLITLNSIAEYVKSTSLDDEFIKLILSASGLSRRPTEWDRENLKSWRGWNFSDEMILYAAKTADGKNNPVAYINAVLSSWKSDGVFSPDKIPSHAKQTGSVNSAAIKTRNYTKEELDSLIDDIDDVEF